MTKYEDYWETLILMWNNKALTEMLQNTSYTATLLTDDYIDWAGEL